MLTAMTAGQMSWWRKQTTTGDDTAEEETAAEVSTSDHRLSNGTGTFGGA